jgi:hypothetical protein
LRRIEYKKLASQADTEQMDMLFQHARTRYLLTNIQTDTKSVGTIAEALSWLMVLTGSPARKALNESASGTLSNLRRGCNVFGKGPEFAALGTLKNYKKELKTMLELFGPVEARYVKVNQHLNAAAALQTYLSSVVQDQENLLLGLRSLEKQRADDLKQAAAAIQTLSAAQADLARSLADALHSVATKVLGACGLTITDFCNLFNQLSFTSVEPSQRKGIAGFIDGLDTRGHAMIFSQVGDMLTKAIQNVPSDLGPSLNKNFVVRRLQYLGEDVKSIDKLKETKDGLIQRDPSGEYRLLATREQLEAILSNFYQQFPEANQASHIFDQYIETVAARNSKVDEYNQLLSGLCYVRAEQEKTKTRIGQAATAQKQSANPGLPTMAAYASALRRHALERIVEQLYTASGIYALYALDYRNIFGEVLGKMTTDSGPGELNAEFLDAALIELISNTLDSTQKNKATEVTRLPDGEHCRLTLTPKRNPLLFKMLKAGKAGSFAILPAGPTTSIDQNPFAGMSEVRIQAIRCIADGMKTRDNVHIINLTHPGIETFYTQAGRQVRLSHAPRTVQCSYNADEIASAKFAALPVDERMMGPFCQWIIAIPAGDNGDLDLTELESITLEFKVKCRAFTGT